MRRVAIALVYAVDVQDGEHPQEGTLDRFVSALTEIAGAEVLFGSTALAIEERDWQDPDFDVTVRSHGRALEPIPFD